VYQERGNGDVEARAEAAVDADQRALPEAVEDQSAVGLGEPELPRRARVLDGRQRAATAAAAAASSSNQKHRGGGCKG
jgi:hypothetical protein